MLVEYWTVWWYKEPRQFSDWILTLVRTQVSEVEKQSTSSVLCAVFLYVLTFIWATFIIIAFFSSSTVSDFVRYTWSFKKRCIQKNPLGPSQSQDNRTFSIFRRITKICLLFVILTSFYLDVCRCSYCIIMFSYDEVWNYHIMYHVQITVSWFCYIILSVFKKRMAQ